MLPTRSYSISKYTKCCLNDVFPLAKAAAVANKLANGVLMWGVIYT